MMGTSLVLALTLAFGGAETAPAPSRQPFPDIELADLGGQHHSLTTFRGAVTVLNFWATWCGPCKWELPQLQKLTNELGGRGLVVLALNVDDPPVRVKQFIDYAKVSLPVFLIDARTQGALGIDRIPFTVLLDREGKIVRAYPGYSEEGMKDLREQAIALLGQGGK